MSWLIDTKKSLLFLAATMAATLGNHIIPSVTSGPKKDSIFYSADSIRHVVSIPAKYDRSFLEKLKTFKGNIKLSENHIVAGKDTVAFPPAPKLLKTYVFSTFSDGKKYLLSLKRTSYTTLQFSFRCIANGGTSSFEKGEAVLDPFFFNGTNAFDDLETGEIFPAYEYISKNSRRFFSIHCSTDPDQQGRLRAVVSFHPNPYPVKSRTSPILKTLASASS